MVMNRRIMIGRKQVFIALVLFLAALTLGASGFNPIDVILLLGLMSLVLSIATRPLSRFIARLGYSIRWKFESAIAIVAVLFLIISLIQVAAMDYMHNGLHDIQDLMASQRGEQLPPATHDLEETRQGIFGAINDLEDNHHGPFYRLIPVLAVIGVFGAASLGTAMAWLVIDPVNSMGGSMRRIASGDFSEPVAVENEDELGELADRINQTAEDLAKLQEATLAEERARALRERIIQVTTAQEEERRRISRDLHDGLGPSLAAIGNRLRACQYMVRKEPEQAERELDEIASGLKGHVQEIRQLIHELRPLSVDQLGLPGAVEQQVGLFGQDTGIQASFAMSGEVGLNPFAEVTVFRVVQECLTNVQKHANASRVDVRFQAVDGGLEVTVSDDGRGFDAGEAASGTAERGMGLVSMRERAELLGGSLRIESNPESGSRVVMYIPTQEVEVGVHSSPTGR